jgi:hypothetical protein
MNTEESRVLYFDLENSLLDCKSMRDSLVQFLGIPEAPDNFLLRQEAPTDLDSLLEQIKPKLVVVDSLRAFRPDVTEKNRSAGEWLKQIRSLCRRIDCSLDEHALLMERAKDFRGNITKTIEWLLRSVKRAAIIGVRPVGNRGRRVSFSIRFPNGMVVHGFFWSRGGQLLGPRRRTENRWTRSVDGPPRFWGAVRQLCEEHFAPQAEQEPGREYQEVS